MMIVVQVLMLGAAMTVALFYFGFGAARVLLPPHFAPWRVLITPLVGMALVMVWDYLALFFGFDLTRATWGLALLTTLLNLAVLARKWRADRRSFLHPVFPRAHWLVITFAFVAFAAAVAPLARYGYVTVIGENWDYEFYLPLADYLREMPTAALVNAPPNPLLTTILSRHIFPLPMGFSYLHATLDVLLQLEALDSFAVLLGVLHALGVIAAFVFFRATLNMSVRAALVAAGLLALNGLLLWFTYWGFGLHLTALALLPVGVAMGIYALWGMQGKKGSEGNEGNRETGKQGNKGTEGNGGTERECVREGERERGGEEGGEGGEGTGRTRWRAVGSAGLFLAALNVTYHPALVAAALPLAGLGVYQLVAGKKRGETILRGAAILALTVALSFPVLFHLQDFIREYYGRAPLAIGLREFVPLSDGYGFSLYLLNLAVGHTIPTPWLFDIAVRVWDTGAPLLTLLALVSSLYALWQLRRDRERRVVWYLVVGASVFYIALFRLPFLRAYPYGFLKSLSLVSYVLIALAVQGVAYGKSRIAYGVWHLVILALFFLFTAFTFTLALEQYFKPQPAFFDADALTLRELKTRVAADAEIFLTDRAEVQEIPMGLAAYALRQNSLRGNVTTGYGKLENAKAGRVYDYALLARGEEPTTRGYQDDAVWQNETFALFPRVQGVVAHRAVNAQTVAPQILTFTLGAQEIVSGTKMISATQSKRDVTIAFASFVPQHVTLQVDGKSAEVELTPGLTTYTAFNVDLPATLTVSPTVAPELLDAAQSPIPHELPAADLTLFVPYVQLGQAHAGQNMKMNAASALVRCTNMNASDGSVVLATWLDARCLVVNPNGENFKWRWIVRGTRAGTREEQVMAQTEMVGAPRQRVDIAARENGGMSVRFDDAPPQSFTTPALPDGKYRGALEIFRGEVLLARIPLYTFEVKNEGAQLTRDTGVSPLVILAR